MQTKERTFALDLAEKAGGKVTDLYGKDQLYDSTMRGLVVSNGSVHTSLLDVIASLIPNQ